MLSIYDAMSPAQAFLKSKAAQRRALEIDDGLAEARRWDSHICTLTGTFEKPRQS